MEQREAKEPKETVCICTACIWMKKIRNFGYEQYLSWFKTVDLCIATCYNAYKYIINIHKNE